MQPVHSDHCHIEGKEQPSAPRIWTADDKSDKQSSKKHDLSGQKYPHPEGRCFLLLFGIIKLRGQCCTSFRQLEPPPRRENRTRMPPPSRQELPRNCPSEAARASATPDPWLARDSDPPPVRSGATTAGTPWE